MMNLDLPPALPHHAIVSEALALLADPAAAEALYRKLLGAHNKAQDAHSEAMKLRGEVAEKQTALIQERASFEADKTAHRDWLRDAGIKLDNRAAELEATARNRAADVAAREARMADATKQHDQRAAEFLETVQRIITEAHRLLPE